ncbi:MAG TPA: hypothetical protein VMS56_11165 [Thermoanaerobaculia bacterium]|nr:hypothetical protein [Thermoanaerobaculia bacterium]
MKKVVMMTALVGLMAGGAMASAFRAADTVYLPVAGKVAGGGGSFFRTDVWISNVSTSSVDVWVAYGARLQDNANAPANAVMLATPLAPGERREIVDVMGAVFGTPDDPGALGQLIFFACRVGGNCGDCDTNAADCLPITVEARIYTTAADGSTFGQLIPGIPWYNFVSVDQVTTGLDEVFIVGVRQNENYRTNIGLVNASQFSSATLRVRLFQSDGTQFGSTFERTLPPLSMDQIAIPSMFTGFSGTGAWVHIEQAPLTTGSDPGFLAYGSMLDNESNDPTYLEAQYVPEMPWECVYGAKGIRRLADHP